MYSTAHELGIANFRDDVEARDVITSLERTINRLVIHAEHENNYIHPDLKKNERRASSRHSKRTIRTMIRSMPN